MLPAFDESFVEHAASLASRGHATLGGDSRWIRDFPTGGEHPEDASSPLDIVLPGFYPAVYPWPRRGARQTARTASLGPVAWKPSRNPRRTLIWDSANPMPRSATPR